MSAIVNANELRLGVNEAMVMFHLTNKMVDFSGIHTLWLHKKFTKLC